MPLIAHRDSCDDVAVGLFRFMFLRSHEQMPSQNQIDACIGASASRQDQTSYVARFEIE